jgi:glycosyltransferase involved in cell wall biosynthesis
MANYPLVSCVCLSNNRPSFLKRAIASFRSQTYPNKELVVVCKDNDEGSITLLRSVQNEDLKMVLVDSGEDLTIGDLRNISIENAAGTYFCQWDDDDWYHARRLEVQYREMKKHKKDASILAYWLMFDQVNIKAYVSLPHMWAASIFCRKELVTDEVRYPSLNFNEDSTFVSMLYARNYVFPIIMPSLYIYVYHGGNTCTADHFRFFFNESQELSEKATRLIHDVVADKYHNRKASSLLNRHETLNEFNYLHYRV